MPGIRLREAIGDGRHQIASRGRQWNTSDRALTRPSLKRSHDEQSATCASGSGSTPTTTRSRFEADQAPMRLVVTGHLVSDPEAWESSNGQPRFRFDVEAEPAYPSVLGPAPPATIRVVVAGPGSTLVIADLRVGSRVRVVGSPVGGLTLIATHVTPLDEPPDTPAIPAD